MPARTDHVDVSALRGVHALSLLMTIGILATGTSANLTKTTPARTRDAEKYKPRNVLIEVVNLTSVHLRWDPPLLDSSAPTPCPVQRYTIRLKTEGARRSRTWKIDPSRTSVTLHDLLVDQTYFVRLLAVVCDGKGKPSRWIRVRASEGAPGGAGGGGGGGLGAEEGSELSAPGKPTYVRTRTFPDSVIVSWLPPDDTTVIRGYMVGYGEGVPDVNWQYVEAARKNVTIKNLKPATQYIVSLRAFNNFGKGPVVYDLIYTRELAPSTAGPSTAPTDLRARILSPSTAWLQWTDPSLGRLQQLTDSRYYNVHYQALTPPPSLPAAPSTGGSELPAGGDAAGFEGGAAAGGGTGAGGTSGGAGGGGAAGGGGGKTLSVIVKALHVVLYDLLPGMKYEFKVRTVKDAQASAFSEAVVNKTFETAPSSPPRALTVVGTNATSVVHASWRPPRQPNGDVTGYLVLYSQAPDQPIEEWQLLTVTGNETEAVVTNLRPNRTYHFRVQARNSQGYSPTSASVSQYTGDTQLEDQNSRTDLNSLDDLDPDNDLHPVGVSQTNLTPPIYDPDSDNDSDDDATDDYDDEDDDNDDDDADTLPRAQMLQQQAASAPPQQAPTPSKQKPGKKRLEASSGSDGKSKRAQNQKRPEFPFPKGTDDVRREEEMDVSFGAVIRHQISAYITWPETFQGCGDAPSRRASSPSGVSSPAGIMAAGGSVVGYTLRYRHDVATVTSQVTGTQGSVTSQAAVTSQYADRNVTVNVALLDNLLPNARYRYRIRYLMDNGAVSAWSREKTLDTHYATSSADPA